MFSDTDDGQTQYCPMCQEWAEKYEKLKEENERLKAENKRLKRLINTHLTTFDKCCVNGLIMNEVLKDV